MYEDGNSSTQGSIVIHVEPLQSAFFAGECFTAKITFTNIAQPATVNSVYRNGTLDKESLPQRPATATGSTFTSSTHKRAAQSITYGSAPLANPPTSPGTPHYSSQFSMSTPSLNVALVARLASSSDKLVARKGLVGVRGNGHASHAGAPNGLQDGSGMMLEAVGPEQRKRMVPKRSLSVDITPSRSMLGGASPVVKDEFVPAFGSSRIHPQSPLSRPRAQTGSSNPSASPTVSSPLARSPSMPLPKSHPHARKTSVFEGHASDSHPSPDLPSSLSLPSNLAAYTLSTSPVPPSPATSVSASSSYSASLDPISETPSATAEPSNLVSPRAQPAIFSPVSSAGARLYSPKPIRASEPSHLTDGGHSRRSSLSHLSAAIGLGQPPPSSTSRPHTRSQSIQVKPSPAKTQSGNRGPFSSSFAPPNTEVLLWSYAQLIGTVELDDTSGLIAPEAAGHLRGRLNSLRTDGVFGGGRMDIGAPMTPSPTSAGGGGPGKRRSFIASLWSGGGSASATPTASPMTPGGAFGLGMNTLSSLWTSPAVSPIVAGFSSGPTTVSSPMAGLSGGLPASALPTFETQPSLLAVDLNLAPGESRSYTYSVPLPAVLPPTFRGRAMKFSYHLVLGSSRAEPVSPIMSTPTLEHQGGHQSKIMRVPIRVYNHVSVERPSIPYDLLWPLARRRTGPEKTTVIEEPPVSVVKHLPNAAKRMLPRGRNDHFEDYVTRLLALSSEPSRSSDVDDDTGTIRYHSLDGQEARTMSPSITLGELDEVLSGGMVGCRENVEILTRVSRKMSYNITKESVKVAELTFVKSAFRVGETVTGLVEFNTSRTRARVLKVTAILEAHEVLPSGLDMSKSQPQAKTRALRRVHAQYHSSMVMDSRRIPFSLDIPSDASPGFRVTLEDGGGGGLEWRVRMCFLVAMGSESRNDDEEEDETGRRTSSRHLVRDGSGGDWGTSWKATPGLAPITRTDGPAGNPYRQAASSSSSPWSLFTTRLVDRAAEDDVEGWQECGVETVECEVGITVWPGNTLYRPPQLDFNI